jgi:hypothetical protein
MVQTLLGDRYKIVSKQLRLIYITIQLNFYEYSVNRKMKACFRSAGSKFERLSASDDHHPAGIVALRQSSHCDDNFFILTAKTAYSMVNVYSHLAMFRRTQSIFLDFGMVDVWDTNVDAEILRHPPRTFKKKHGERRKS